MHMKSKYQLAKKLIHELEEYELEVGENEGNMESFSNWLSKRHGNHQRESWPESLGKPVGEYDPSSVLSILLTLLFRSAKHYMKKVLEDSPLSTIDEFAFLATLINGDSLTKSELINNNLLEFTSGIEIIKRLKKNGFIEEFPDPEDKRSKRVQISNVGKGIFFQLIGPMEQVSNIVAGDLTEEEKGIILPVLSRLHDFHATIHKEDRKSDIGLIYEKYLRP